MEDISIIAAVAEDALRRAGELLKSQFRVPTSTSKKSGREITISQDKHAENLIIQTIHQQFSAHTIHSEEAGDLYLGSHYQWIIDPLEGTTNYAAGMPFFATQLAVAHKSKLIHSAIYAPMFNDYYSSTASQGSHLEKKLIRVQENTSLAESVVSFGKGSQEEHLIWLNSALPKVTSLTRSVRMFGAAGLELALVASGGIAAYINYGSKVTDYASGALLVREAGGVVKNFTGEDWQLGDSSLVAGNEQIVIELVAALNSGSNT